MVGSEFKGLLYRGLYQGISVAIGPLFALPAVVYAPVYGVVVAALLVGLLWRIPAAGLVLFPLSTLLVPELPTPVEFQLSANVGLIAAFVSVVLFKYRRFVLPQRYLLAMTAVFALSLAATVRGLFTAAETRPFQFLYLLQWIGYLAFPLSVVVFVQRVSEREWERVYRATLLTATLASAAIVVHLITVYFGVLPAVAGGEEVERAVGRERLRTIWTQGPNTTGMFLTIQALFGYTFLLSFRGRWRRIAAGAYALLTTVLMFYTYSRSALIALLVGVLVITVVWRVHYVVALAVGFLVSLPVLPTTIRQRFVPSDPFAPRYIETLGRSLPVGPLAGRVTLWAGYLDDFLQYPLLGKGFFWVALDNTYLNLTVGTGILGLAAYLGLFVVLLRLCYGSYRSFEGSDRLNATVGLATLGSLAAFFAWGLFSEVFARWRVLGLLSTLLALTIGAAYRGYLIGNETAEDAKVGLEETIQ